MEMGVADRTCKHPISRFARSYTFEDIEWLHESGVELAILPKIQLLIRDGDRHLERRDTKLHVGLLVGLGYSDDKGFPVPEGNRVRMTILFVRGIRRRFGLDNAIIRATRQHEESIMATLILIETSRCETSLDNNRITLKLVHGIDVVMSANHCIHGLQISH